MDTEFLRKFRELKKQRNNHLIDEPDFDEAVEQLAANVYAHPAMPGYCCACDYDKAFMQSEIAQKAAEAGRKARIDENTLWNLRAKSIKSKSIMAVSFLDRNAGLQDPDPRYDEYYFREERAQLTDTNVGDPPQKPGEEEV